jgi:hypothetical protein
MPASRLSAFGVLAFLSLSALAQEPTDANLITAIDVSGSVKAPDERLELEGMAEAVLNPRFLQAIARGHHRRIGFTAFTWANGEFLTLVPWSVIASRADALQIAARLRAARGHQVVGYATRIPGTHRPWKTGHATDVSAAIERAMEIDAAAPFATNHHVINMCANGVDNVGGGPDAARDRADTAGLIINGLILGDRDDASEVAAWFRDHVQAGPGSFVIEARGFEDIASALLAKFLFELVVVPPRRAPMPS